MEDHTLQPTSAEKASARSASALRELEQRAHAALTANRDQVSRLETEITRQLDEIATTLQEQTATEAPGAADAEHTRAQIELLTQELAESRAAWEAERAILTTERDELAAKVASLESRQHADQDELGKSLAAWETEWTALESQCDELAAQVNSLESQQQSAEQELAKSRADWETERAALASQRDELAAKVASLESQQPPAEQESNALRTAWDAERAALEARCDELAAQATSLESQQHAAQQELSDSRAAWEAERASLAAHRDELTTQAAALESQQHTAQDEWRNQLLDFEARLRDQQASWNEQRAEWSDTCTNLERERDELQQKFELALQDLQRFRGRIAEMEQELSRRPETNYADSTELVALRAERDALSRRVEELEQQPAAQMDANVEQQLADFQRRFELAVEDVRELKTKNAKLESELATAGAKSAAPVASGGMDWESQKRRLLASLEGEAEPNPDPAREKERTTIEGTIEMTDAVVAEKDREIAELKAQLADGAVSAQADGERDRKINDLVDTDEVIAEHRKRIGQLERETDAKLRAAELELSIERAKMARQKADLEELKSDLESRRQEYEANGGTPGAPRRKWLSKLGLSGEE